MVRYKVTLTQDEHEFCKSILGRGKHSSQQYRNACMDRKPYPKKDPVKTDGDFEAHLIALSCSEAPEGYARWSLRMLAVKMVELKYIDSISHEAVRQV